MESPSSGEACELGTLDSLVDGLEGFAPSPFNVLVRHASLSVRGTNRSAPVQSRKWKLLPHQIDGTGRPNSEFERHVHPPCFRFGIF